MLICGIRRAKHPSSIDNTLGPSSFTRFERVAGVSLPKLAYHLIYLVTQRESDAAASYKMMCFTHMKDCYKASALWIQSTGSPFHLPSSHATGMIYTKVGFNTLNIVSEKTESIVPCLDLLTIQFSSPLFFCHFICQNWSHRNHCFVKSSDVR